MILFLGVWHMAKTPSRSFFLFPSTRRPVRKSATMVEWREVGSFGNELYLSLLLSHLESNCLFCCGICMELLWAVLFLVFKDRIIHHCLYWYIKIFLIAYQRDSKLYMPYFHLYSQLNCIVQKSWFKSILALRYFTGIALKGHQDSIQALAAFSC